MVGASMDDLAAALQRTYPELEAVHRAAREPVYVVGGAVRDLLLGRPRADLDLVVVADPVALAECLGSAVIEHARFGTAKLALDGHEVDIATARTETYPYPGALPVVEPAATIEEDLGRRDFTVNAMAVPLEGPRLIDPQGGREDLERALLRVLHERSFVDDPTRAIRAARYAARFRFALEPETERLLRKADLTTVSADRRWAELVPRERALVAAALGPPGAEEVLASMWKPRPGEGVEMAERRDPVELILARAMGADWLDSYLTAWRKIQLEID